MKSTLLILKKAKKEVIYKFITSLFIQGLLLIIPIFWTDSINNLTDGIYHKTYFLIIITLILSILYYIWAYLNQKSWYKLYNKLYLEYTIIAVNGSKEKISNLDLGEYTNIINNDIDILCNFLGNGITRILQIFEFLIIYIYFLSLDFYIFLITLLVSVIMIIIIITYSKKIQKENIKRKTNLDKKTSYSHEVYNTVINNKKNFKKRHDLLFDSCKEYLRSHYRFNVNAMGMIYFVLGVISFTRYILIFYSVYLVYIGNIEIGTILLIYTYYDKIIANFEVLGTISAEYQSFKVSLNRLNKLNN